MVERRWRLAQHPSRNRFRDEMSMVERKPTGLGIAGISGFRDNISMVERINCRAEARQGQRFRDDISMAESMSMVERHRFVTLVTCLQFRDDPSRTENKDRRLVGDKISRQYR